MFKTKNQKRLFSNRTTDVVERRAADVMRKHETALTVERENEERKAFERMVDQACEILNNLKVLKAKRRGWIWFVATMLVAGVIGFAFWGISKTDETHVVEQTSVSAPVSAPKDVSTKSVAAQKTDVVPEVVKNNTEELAKQKFILKMNLFFFVIFALASVVLLVLSKNGIISKDTAGAIWFCVFLALLFLAWLCVSEMLMGHVGLIFILLFCMVSCAVVYFGKES